MTTSQGGEKMNSKTARFHLLSVRRHVNETLRAITPVAEDKDLCCHQELSDMRQQLVGIASDVDILIEHLEADAWGVEAA